MNLVVSVIVQATLVSYCHPACFNIDRENYRLSDYKFSYESFWKSYTKYTSSDPDLKKSQLELTSQCHQHSTFNEDFGGYYAWTVKLSPKGSGCSGSWIDQRFVLTTASCAGHVNSAAMGSNTTESDQAVEIGVSAIFKPETDNVQDVALVELSSSYVHGEYKPLCLALNETQRDCVVLGEGNDGVNKRDLDVVPLDPSLCAYVARLRGFATDERSTCFRITTLKNLNHWTSEAGSAVVCNMDGPGPPQVEGVLQTELRMSDGENPFMVTRVATFNEWIVEKIVHHRHI